MSQTRDFDPALHVEREETADGGTAKPAGRQDSGTAKPAGRLEGGESEPETDEK